jgi:hypothetical protein
MRKAISFFAPGLIVAAAIASGCNLARAQNSPGNPDALGVSFSELKAMEAVGMCGNHLFRTTLFSAELDGRLAARTEFQCKGILC